MPILRTRGFPEPGGRAGKGAVLESHGCNYGLGFRGQVKECGSSSIVTRRVIVGCQLFHEPVLERHIDAERDTDSNPERIHEFGSAQGRARMENDVEIKEA